MQIITVHPGTMIAAEGEREGKYLKENTQV